MFNPNPFRISSPNPGDALEVLLGRAVADHGDVLRHIGPFHRDPTVISRSFNGGCSWWSNGDWMVMIWIQWWFSMVIIWWLYDIIWYYMVIYYGMALWIAEFLYVEFWIASGKLTGDATSTHFRFLIGDEGWIPGIPRFNRSFARTGSDLELLTI